MQRPDEKKRKLIVASAARLFATRPFHKVKLDAIAAAAGVGKGTLYVYFKNKEDLYFSLIYDGFSQLVDRLELQLGHGEMSPKETLGRICREVVGFGFGHPHFFELIRAAGGAMKHPRWDSKRKMLSGLIEQTIRRGVASGVFDDPHPEITALCIPGLIRSIMLYGPKGQLDEDVVTSHITHWVERGVGSMGDGDCGGKSMNGKRVASRRKRPTRQGGLAAAGRNHS